MQWYEPEVEALERDIARRTNGAHPPVFYGSSSIRLWTTLAKDFDPHVLNLGFGGSTLQACDYFFARLIPPVNPMSLLVYAGDNDLGDGRSVEDTLSSFRSLADKVATSLGPIPFGFVSVKPSPARSMIIDRIRLFNNLVRHEIETRPSGYYVDIYASMLNQSGGLRSELYLEDGLHRALRAALHQRSVLHVRVLELD